MVKTLIAALFSIPTLGFAQSALPAIDYPALFELHADSITTVSGADGINGRQLSLSGEIRITETGPIGQRRYVGADLSQAGAVGCFANLMIEIAGLLESCPDKTTAPQKERLEFALTQVFAFVAQNTFPPHPLATVDASARARIIAIKALSSQEPQYCAENEAGIARIGDGLVNDGFTTELAAILAVPRLPVMNPCL